MAERKEDVRPTTVINVKSAPKGWRDDPRYVDVRRMRNGRVNPTPGKVGYLGNPYKIGAASPAWSEGDFTPLDRSAVVALFATYAASKMRTDPEYRAAVTGLAGKTLVCCCAPLSCHGDVLAKLADAAVAPDAKEGEA